MKTTVLEFKIDGLLELRATGSNAGRFDRYCLRHGCNPGEDEARVEYESSRSGEWSFIEPSDAMQAGTKVRAFPVFYETTYQIHCRFLGRNVRNARVVHPLASVADEFDFEEGRLTGPLDFINAPGRFTLEIAFEENGVDRAVKLSWWVVSEKLDVVRDYTPIRDRIEAAKPGLVYAFLSKTKNAAGLSGAAGGSDSVWYAIFESHVAQYREACEHIVRRPHLRYVEKTRHLRADRIRRWDVRLANRYFETEEGRREIEFFRASEIEPETDSLENRFVLFTLIQFSERLKAFAERCRKEGGDRVSESFIQQMERESAELSGLARQPFFRRVGRFTGFKQGSLALQRKRGYAEIFDTWLKLKCSLDFMGDGLNVGNQPIWKLYEFWCFLVLRDHLASLYPEPEGSLGNLAEPADIFEDPYDEESGFSKTPRSDKKCEYVFSDSTGRRKIKLTYQLSYGGGKTGQGEEEGNFSYAVEQIPDIVMTILPDKEGTGSAFTYLFDAKYRILPYPSAQRHEKDASPPVAINDMHRYRDAILYRAQKEAKLEREIIGAYVLFPGRPDKSFPYGPIIEKENIGAIPLLPGEDGEKPLKDFVSSILVQHEARTILGSALTVRGTSLFVNGVPPRKDEVLTIKDSRGRDTMLNSSINVAWMKTDSSAVGSEEFARKVRFVIIVVNETKLENQIRFVRRFEGKMDGGQLNLRLGLPSDSTVGIEESESYWVWQLA